MCRYGVRFVVRGGSDLLGHVTRQKMEDSSEAAMKLEVEGNGGGGRS